MVKIEIWIASHFHSQQRFEWAKSMVKSLSNSTRVPDVIYVSCSQEPYVKGCIKDIFDGYPSLNVTVFSSPMRQTQFQHLNIIYHNTKAHSRPDTFIFFCDDDDMYNTRRIGTLEEAISSFPNVDVFHDKSVLVDGASTPERIEDPGTRDGTIALVNNAGFIDFCNYAIRVSVMKEFLEEIMDAKLIPEKYGGMADCAFQAWLKTKEMYALDECLYYARKAIDVPFANCWSLGSDVDFELIRRKRGLDKIYYFQ